jgi:copper chaperone CopZ
MRTSIFFAALIAMIGLIGCADDDTNSVLASKPQIKIQYAQALSDTSKTVANIAIEGVHCDACRGKIKKEIAMLAGVTSTGFSSTKIGDYETAVIEYDPNLCKPEKMVEVINTIVDGAYTVQSMQVVTVSPAE